MRAAKQSGALLFFQYFGFFVIGVVGSMLGTLIPSIREELELSYGLAGILFPAQAAGGLAVLLLSGLLIHLLGKRKLLFAGCAAFLAGLVCAAAANGLPLLLAGSFFMGAGMSLFDVGISTICLDANPEGRGKALGRLHFFFGAGAVAGPLVALAAGGLESGWRWAFGLCAAGPLVVFVFLLFVGLPLSPPAEPEKRFAVFRRPLLWLSALALCFYCGVEWGVGAWFPSYWKETPLAVVIDPAFATSLFWLTFAVGRFIFGPYADRLGFRKFLGISFAATALVVSLWFFFPDPVFSFAIVLILGFVTAAQYPTIVALGSHKFPASSGQVTSFLSVFAVAGTSLWPSAIGFWADHSGIGALVGAELILTAGMIVFGLLAFAADRRQKKL